MLLVICPRLLQLAIVGGSIVKRLWVNHLKYARGPLREEVIHGAIVAQAVIQHSLLINHTLLLIDHIVLSKKQ